jgi:hypothetical protein
MIRLCAHEFFGDWRNHHRLMKALFGPTTVNGWQRTVHWFFVLTFALILPFICFGALAMPGHPHGASHFVFAAPPEIDQSSPTLLSVLLASWCGLPLDSDSIDRTFVSLASVDGDTESRPVSQSVPSTVLSSLLLLIASLWLMRRMEIPDLTIFVPLVAFRPVDLPVPTPPPRPFL